MVKHILYLRFICPLVFVSVGLSLPAIADDGTKIPVKLNAKLATFFDGVDPAWITDPQAGLAAPFPKKDEAQAEPGYAVMLQTLNVDGRHRSKVFNCNEMLKLDAEGFIAAPEGTSLSSYNLYGRCELLNYLAKAKPSKSSAISKLDFNAPDVQFHLPHMALSGNLYHVVEHVLPSWRMRASMMDFNCVEQFPRLNTELQWEAYRRCQKDHGPYNEDYMQAFRYRGLESDNPHLWVYEDLDFERMEPPVFIPKILDELTFSILAKADFDGDGSEDLILYHHCPPNWTCWIQLTINYTDEGMVPWGKNRVHDYQMSAPLFFVLSKTEKDNVAYYSNLCELARKFIFSYNHSEIPNISVRSFDCDTPPYYTPLPRRYWPDYKMDPENNNWLR